MKRSFLKNFLLFVLLLGLSFTMACQIKGNNIISSGTDDLSCLTNHNTVEQDYTSESVSVELEGDTFDEETIVEDHFFSGVELISDPLYVSTMNVLETNDSYDNANFGNHSSDIVLQGTTEKRESLMNTQMNCSFADSVFVGNYTQSFNSPYYRGSFHTYSGILENENKILFSINQDTGKIVAFKYPDGYVEKNLELPILTEQQNLLLAEKYLASYLGDSAKDFRLDYFRYRNVPEYANGVYTYGFVRMVGDLKTDEAVSIKITDRGVMVYFYAFQPGSMDNVGIPNYNEPDLMASIEYKLANIYVDQMKNNRVFYEIEDVWLTMLNDGKLYLRYNMKVNVYANETETFKTDYTNLLVCIS